MDKNKVGLPKPCFKAFLSKDDKNQGLGNGLGLWIRIKVRNRGFTYVWAINNQEKSELGQGDFEEKEKIWVEDGDIGK